MAKVSATPPDLAECGTFKDYKMQVEAWQEVVDIDVKKRGIVLALSLPEEKTKFGKAIKSSVFKSCSLDTMKKETGVKSVLEALDEIIGEDETTATIAKFRELEKIRRSRGQTIEDYILEFKRVMEEYESAGTKMHNTHKGWLLLIRADLPEMQEQMVLSGLTVNNDLYKQVETKLKFVLGKTMKGAGEASHAPTKTDQEEAMAAKAFYAKHKYKNSNKPPNNGDLNPKNRFGKTLTCSICNSYRHLRKECPHKDPKEKKTSYKKGKGKTAFVIDEHEDSSSSSDELEEVHTVERIVLLTHKSKELTKFTKEAVNAAALDTCCSSNVAGSKWFDIYKQSLPENLQDMVIGPKPSNKRYLFGNQGILSAVAGYKVPVMIGGEQSTIELDVINSDIPLLMSKPEMKKRNMILDMPNDRIWIGKKEIPLKTTSAGHYVLSLLPDNREEIDLQEIYAVNLKNASEKEIEEVLSKLHKQFGHRPRQVFIDLLQSADSWKPSYGKILDKIQNGCSGCIKRRRKPDKPAVTLPSAKEFNDKVAIDLKIYKGKYILYMVDMFSRYTVAALIQRKRPDDVIDALMKKWVCYHGTMRVLLSDNGGEFTGDEMTEIKSMLNVEEHTTAAESPWQNGICERNHAVVDNILQSIDEDYPEMDLATKLAWACTAKNSMMTVYGYSPFMLVYGKNPTLPNLVSDPPPAWENSCMSEKLQKHLDALHSTRKAFVKSERCEKLRIALKKKIRNIEREYEQGDKVYYMRENQNRWLGPAKVVFQDGKIIFVRQGKYLIRVSANRLLPETGYLSDEPKLAPATADGLREGVEINEERRPQAKKITPRMNIEVDHSDGSSDFGQFPTSGDVQNASHSDEVAPENHRVIDQGSQEGNIQNALSEPNTPTDQANDLESSSNTATPEATQDGNAGHRTAAVPEKPKSKLDIWIWNNSDWHRAKILGRGAKATGQYKNWWNIRYSNEKEDCVNLESELWTTQSPHNEEVCAVTISKERKNSPECLLAKQEELEKLKSFQTYTEISDQGQDYVSSTWVLTHKAGKIKARLVARGFEEGDQESIRKDSPTLEKSSLRVILMIAAMKKWSIKTTDVKSAFLQGSDLTREVLIKPPKEANSKGKLWKLKKCLYGLQDASRMWYLKVEKRLKQLGFQQSVMDYGLFYLKKNDNLIGLIGLHVDDFFHLGNEEFDEIIMPQVLDGIQVGKSEQNHFLYTGFEIDQNKTGITLQQKKFIEDLEIPKLDLEGQDNKRGLSDQETTLLRKMTGTLNWAVRATRPDLSFEMVDLSTRFQNGTVQDLKRARKALCNLKNNPKQIQFPTLIDDNTLTIEVYTDAALRNLNNGEGSTGAYILFARNEDTNNSLPIDWQTKKIKRVVHSSLAAEALSLLAGLETAIAFKNLFSELLGSHMSCVKIKGHCDNKPTCEAIYSTRLVDDKRLRMEIGGIREMITSKEVWSVDWLKGQQQLADCMTKGGQSGEYLCHVLETGKIPQY